jgi:hypothetical protein
MSDFEQKKIEMELNRFTSTNFERPSACENLEQVRFYVNELCNVIREHETKFSYVPATAYSLLAQYNARQNSMLYQEFITTY